MTDAASLADRVREGDLRLHELEAHADADTAAEARDCSSNRSPARRSTRSGTTASRRRRRVRHREHGRLDPGADGRRRPCQRRRRRLVAGEKYLPPTTTEGALASVNRGCSVINSAGGATARVPQVRDDPRAGVPRRRRCRGRGARPWTRDNFAALKEAAEETTNHGELLDVTPYVVGNSVYLRFRYDTKDAMGMNMATIATEAVCGVVEAETAACARPPSATSVPTRSPPPSTPSRGGRSVTADVRIPREVVEERLHTTPEAVAELNTRKNLVGSAKAASLGFNAHVANVVAAMFLATGQDEAQVVEGANAITTAEVQDGDLYVSVSIASPRSRHRRRRHETPDAVRGPSISSASVRRRPRRLQRRRPRRMHRRRFPAGELSLLSARASRAPLQRPRRTRSVTVTWGLLSDRDS